MLFQLLSLCNQDVILVIRYELQRWKLGHKSLTLSTALILNKGKNKYKRTNLLARDGTDSDSHVSG